MWIATYAFLSAVMDALTAAAISAFYESVLGKCWVGLYQAPTPAPTPQLLLSGITECNYDGYARQPLVWFRTFLDASGPQIVVAQNMLFAPIDAIVPNTVTGVFVVTASAGGLLYLAAALATPVNLSGPPYSLVSQPTFQLAFTNNYGGPAVLA